MDVPYDVQQLIKGFYPGSATAHTTHEGWIAESLFYFNESQKDVMRRFLDELLSGRYSDDEIEEVWQTQYPSYDFTAGGHRVFFAEIRRALG